MTDPSRAGPDLDPEQFWREAPGAEVWAEMLAKYAALAELAELGEHERQGSLRAAATRWPGSLREAELIGPERVAERRAAAAAGLAEPERARGDWPDEAARAAACWAELHAALADLRRFRAREPKADAERFVRWISGQAEGVRARWPGSEQLAVQTGAKLRVRTAYLWLAARAGLTLPELNRLLLARSGPWDRRPGDPAWAL